MEGCLPPTGLEDSNGAVADTKALAEPLYRSSDSSFETAPLGLLQASVKKWKTHHGIGCGNPRHPYVPTPPPRSWRTGSSSCASDRVFRVMVRVNNLRIRECAGLCAARERGGAVSRYPEPDTVFVCMPFYTYLLRLRTVLSIFLIPEVLRLSQRSLRASLSSVEALCV